jgi:hypothetical protein
MWDVWQVVMLGELTGSIETHKASQVISMLNAANSNYPALLI